MDVGAASLLEETAKIDENLSFFVSTASLSHLTCHELKPWGASKDLTNRMRM